jgi:large subunit ribosomal protein L6
MSRIGKQPVPILDGVSVQIDGRKVTVQGPKGNLSYDIRPEVAVAVEGKQVVVSRINDNRASRAYHGLTRALINNMVIGVKEGYAKKLELQGVGYVCRISGNQLSMRAGYANELHKTVPAGLNVTCPDNTHINIDGCDKQLVGKFAAEVRSLRKPEPYKGKGVRYVGEQVKIKPGKSASK